GANAFHQLERDVILIRHKLTIRFTAVAGLTLALITGPSSWGFATDEARPAAAAPATSKDAPPAKEPEPVTTKDPQIALEDLELLLAPVTKDEIETEAKGWFALLRAKEREISVAELNVRRKNREIAQLEKQKAAAAELAKATEEAKAADKSASKKDKEAATQRVAEAQKTLAKTVDAASKETAKEEKKAEATTEAMAKQADAAPPPAPATDSGSAVASASDQDLLQKAAEKAAKTSEGEQDEARVEKVVAASEKEAATTTQVKSLAQTADSAAGAASPMAAGQTSKGAEQLAEKTKEATAAKTDVKVQLVDYSTQLMSERTALVDRLKVVLDKWEQKGGDPKTYRLYIASIGGIKVDVSDQAATWARLKAWLTADEGGLRWARNLAIFVGYILGSIVAAWIVRAILRRVMSGGRFASQLLRDFVVVSSGRIIVALGVLLGLSALEVNLAPLLAVIGAAGFVVAFALQGTLSNFASGILIMVFKPFDVGDQVEVGGDIEGKVSRVSIFSTYIRTDDGFEKIVPNDSIWKNVIVNRTTGHVELPKGAEAKPAEAKSEAG
ncbi:MAG TPA: mechanosensitive ion channel domain-containing protein, partial [Roseiarcus sp.]|nr:mechanosensitive ion channel domain-containing protein [Roseiarcus sp.]